jgi:hypothetical protein
MQTNQTVPARRVEEAAVRLALRRRMKLGGDIYGIATWRREFLTRIYERLNPRVRQPPGSMRAAHHGAGVPR